MDLKNAPRIGLDLSLRKVAVITSLFAIVITTSIFIYTNLTSSSDTLAGTQGNGVVVEGTGPGGVGDSSSNGLWLRADIIDATSGSSVSSWTDYSGFGNHATQSASSKQPTYQNTSSLNNMPVVRFDGTGDELSVPDHALFDSTDGLTFYAVIRPNNLDGQPRGILGKRITYSSNQNYSYTWFFHNSNKLNLDVHTANNRFNSGSTTYSNNTNYILSFDYNGTETASKRSKLYTGSDITAESSESTTFLPAGNQDIILGALNTNYGKYLGADYAEVIQFNYSLDSLEHILIQNYLSAKYNIPLSSSDLYLHDNSASGDFDFDVAGIGQISSSVLHEQSKGSGVLTVYNPSDLDDNEFLFWGRNTGDFKASNTEDVPNNMEARLECVWRASEVNNSGSSIDVGSVDLVWDLSSFNNVSASNLRLLIDTDNDGTFADETAISGAIELGDGRFEFTGVTEISDSVRFTIGTNNVSATTLPVDLLFFKAKKIGGDVELKWATATEINNSHFDIERSLDGESFTRIDREQGHGNSASLIHYSVFDYDVPQQSDPVYYRLKQVDFDGSSEYSSIAYITHEEEDKSKVYPNPASDVINISKNGYEFAVRLLDPAGNEVGYSPMGHDQTQLPVHQLPNGMYFVQVESALGKETHKVLVRH